MMIWIAAHGATIVISIIMLVLIGLAVRHIYRHRGSCGCGCEKGCPGHCDCHSHGMNHKPL